MGDTQKQTFCVRFDPNDKYIAAGKDLRINKDNRSRRWYNKNIQCFYWQTELYSQQQYGRANAYHLDKVFKSKNNSYFRWRPLVAPGVTKNVLISVNANGSLQHWHTTSGKLLHTIHDELNQLLTVDYKPDGTQFATGGSDCIVRVYDE